MILRSLFVLTPLIPTLAMAQVVPEDGTMVGPDEVDWTTSDVTFDAGDGNAFLVSFSNDRCLINFFENDLVTFGYSITEDESVSFVLLPPDSWARGDAAIPVTLSSPKFNENTQQEEVVSRSGNLQLETLSDGLQIYRMADSGWSYVDLFSSHALTVSASGSAAAEYPDIDHRFSAESSRSAVIFFEACVRWMLDEAADRAVAAAEEGEVDWGTIVATMRSASWGTFRVRGTGPHGCELEYARDNENIDFVFYETTAGLSILSLLPPVYGAHVSTPLDAPVPARFVIGNTLDGTISGGDFELEQGSDNDRGEVLREIFSPLTTADFVGANQLEITIAGGDPEAFALDPDETGQVLAAFEDCKTWMEANGAP